MAFNQQIESRAIEIGKLFQNNLKFRLESLFQKVKDKRGEISVEQFLVMKKIITRRLLSFETSIENIDVGKESNNIKSAASNDYSNRGGYEHEKKSYKHSHSENRKHHHQNMVATTNNFRQNEQNQGNKCDQCNLEYPTRNELFIHISNKHCKKVKDRVCFECGEQAQAVKDLWLHYQMVHMDKQEPTCPFCFKKLLSHEQKMKHYIQLHVQDLEKQFIYKLSNFNKAENFKSSVADFQ